MLRYTKTYVAPKALYDHYVTQIRRRHLSTVLIRFHFEMYRFSPRVNPHLNSPTPVGYIGCADADELWKLSKLHKNV
jgi:hypothetical protein